MLLATDPDLIREFVEGASEETGASSLAPRDRGLWEALGGGERLWIREGGLPLPAEGWGRIVLVRATPRSQFDVLRDMASEGTLPAGPIACLALAGRGFHGHRGRSWQALPGNLHLSVALAPFPAPARRGAMIVMVPAVAVVDALREARAGLEPGIKWVNDVHLGGKKVAGVLAATQSQGDRMLSAVLGVGLNVEQAPVLPATPFVAGATSLREAAGDRAPDLARSTWLVLGALMRRVREFLEGGAEALFPAYRRDAVIVGREVRIYEEGLPDACDPSSWPPPLTRGVVAEIAPDLTLRIEGSETPVTRGRLAFEEACREYGV